VRLALSLVVLMLVVAVAAALRTWARAGILGRREAYGRPMSDWAGVTALGIGAGLSALIAGVRWLAWILIGAVMAESVLTLRSVRPRRRRS
jgi:hypothetical protein